jgi:tripartite ATP-independent transporter DctP family solute receptor
MAKLGERIAPKTPVWTRRSVLAAAGAYVPMPALAAPRPGIKLRLAHSLPRSHPVHPAMEYMASLVRDRSSGEITIQVFADGDLGQETQLIEHLRAGRIDLAKVSASVLERRVPIYRVFDVPFLFRDNAHWRATVTGAIAQDILASGIDAGLAGLVFYEAGTRSFYGRQPIMAPEDIRGLPVRIQPSPTMAHLIRALEGVPVELPWAATYSALQTGLVQAAENSIAALIAGRHAEVTRYYCYDEHTAVPDVLVMGGRAWAGLDTDARRLVSDAARDSSERMNALWSIFTGEVRRASEGMGVSFLHPDREPFIARTAAIRQEYAKASDIGPLIAQILRIA